MYSGLLVGVFLISVTVLAWSHATTSLVSALRYGLFHTVSIGTTTGFSTTDFQIWSGFLPLLLVFLSFAGGCAGSTGGGMKAVRAALVFHHSIRELRRLIYPNGVFALRFGRQSIPDRVLQAVWGFVGVYITISVIFTLLFTMTGMDLATAVSAVAASLNNLGVGIGQVGGGFANITDSAKWMMTVLMGAGRLEIFTLLVLFTPMFWKQ